MQASPDEGTQDNASAEWITSSDTIDLSGMNLYCQNDNLNFTADSNAKISLYVRADEDEDGEFIFDDGQDWLLIIETSFGDYPVFPRKYVQLGRVNYTVFNEWTGDAYDIFHVLVTVNQSAGYEIYDCLFDNDKNAFKIVPVYCAENINLMGMSR